MAMFRNSDATMMRTAGELSAAFLSFIVAIALGWWFGDLLDGRFGSSPWMTIVFSSFGVVAGVLNVYRTVSRAMRSVGQSRSGPPSSRD